MKSALVLALLLAGCRPELEAPARGVDAVLGPCDRPNLADAKCGMIEVEEKRSEPNGRTIGLSVVVAPATSRAPAADPVFILAGGPGQGAASVAPMILHRLAALRVERDLVFVDVRGTGASNPLACAIEDHEDVSKLLSGTLEFDAIDACLAAYEAKGGVDLSQYTTKHIVDDLDEVREILGYEQINLLGISYGTAVAQVYMRRHPEHLRSAVLDGVLPIDHSGFLAQPRSAERVLELVLSDCREDPECAAAIPGLGRKLAAVLDDLDTKRVLEEFPHPRTGEPIKTQIARGAFAGTLAGTLYDARLAAILPLAIERAHLGDYGPVAALALHMNRHADSLSMGLYLSVACAEDLAGVDARTRAEAITGLHVFDDHALAQLERACARWPHAPPDPAERQLARSEVPTLLFSGRYDPITPPAFGERVAAQLSHARHVEVASASHGVWSLGCAVELMSTFYASAAPESLDTSCLDTLVRPATFLTANGP